MQAVLVGNTGGYILPVGKDDESRLNALSDIFNNNSYKLLTSVNTLDNPTILDVGCGNGNLACFVAKNLSNSTVVGVDISREQIYVCQKRSTEENIKNVRWEVCDVYKLEDLKIKYPKLFDIVHSRFVLSHVKDIEKAVLQMIGLVKEGGNIIFHEAGAKRKFEETTPTKAILAWKKFVVIQHEMQQSHRDAAEKVLACLNHSDKISSCNSQLFDITIKGSVQKSIFRIGVEHAIKIIAGMNRPDLIKELGYENSKTWLKEMNDFENNDAETIVVKDNESIIAQKIYS